jgi:hypothetical protein
MVKKSILIQLYFLNKRIKIKEIPHVNKPIPVAKAKLPTTYCTKLCHAVSIVSVVMSINVGTPSIAPPHHRLPYIIKGIHGGMLILELAKTMILFNRNR